jgi:hypothetical protein
MEDRPSLPIHSGRLDDSGPQKRIWRRHAMAARACAGGQICVRLHNSEGVVVSLNGDVGLTRGSGGGRFGERALVNRVARATKAAFGTQTGLCRHSNRGARNWSSCSWTYVTASAPAFVGYWLGSLPPEGGGPFQYKLLTTSWSSTGELPLADRKNPTRMAPSSGRRASWASRTSSRRG